MIRDRAAWENTRKGLLNRRDIDGIVVLTIVEDILNRNSKEKRELRMAAGFKFGGLVGGGFLLLRPSQPRSINDSQLDDQVIRYSRIKEGAL